MIEAPAIRTTRTRYDERVKELAYEVYSKRCNGDMPATMKVLETLVDPPLSKNTVYQWRDDHGWIERLEEERRAIAPISWELYFGGLAVAAPETVSYLRSVVNDQTKSDRDRIAAGRAILSQVALHMDELTRRNERPEPEAISDAGLLALEPKWEPGT